MDNKIIGILGGYGHNATIHFQKILAEEINKKYNTRRYLKTFVINDSSLYDKNKVDSINDTSINEELIKINHEKHIEFFKNCKINILVNPCNTYSDIISKLSLKNIKYLHIVEETCKYINKNYKVHNIGLLCTKKTAESNIYKNKLNCNLTILNECLEDINIIIRLTMFGHYNNPPKSLLEELNINKYCDPINMFNNILNKYNNIGINYLILGCTELPLFLEKNISKINNKNIIFISSSHILAKNIINF